MYNGSSASIISGSHSLLAWSKSGCSHLSRFSFIDISELVRFATKTVETFGQDSKASSTMPFRSIVLFPLKEPSLVMTSLQSESLIREERAVAEKPANTTEWMAPIRAQANRETGNSGIIGK